jgi:UDP-glucose 4-epimerase
MNFKRALVTGGAGFIGSHIVDKLMEEGVEVFVIDNYRKGRRSNVAHHFSNSKFLFDRRDIQSAGMYDVFRIFKPEVVFHLAAMPGVAYSVSNPTDSNETNIHGTVNLLNLSHKHGVKRFVFSSSSSVYGGSAVLPTPETTPLNPKSPYALQKKVGEEYCSMFSKLYDIETISLRYFNVFGPRQYGDSPYASVISSFADHLKNGTQPTIHGDGDQFRDFCYVDNVVSANLLAANHEGTFKGDVFNVGCGTTTSVNKLHGLMGVQEAEYTEARAGDVRCSQADITKAAEVLGYRVLVPFDQGLEKTIEWYTNKGL